MILITSAVETYPRKIIDCIKSRSRVPAIVVNLKRDPRLLRNLNPSLTLVHFRGTGYNALTRDGRFEIINSLESITNTTRKHYGQMKAISLGIRSPDTDPLPIEGGSLAVIESRVAAAFESRGWTSCVIKPSTSRGQGVFVLKLERDTFRETLMGINLEIPEWFIQETVSFKRLVRVMTIGGKIVEGAVTYDYPRDGNWKCSVCMNPLALHERDPSPELLDFIRLITQRLTLTDSRGISYIDVFETENGYVYNETNTSCNLVHQERITGVPLADMTAEYLLGEHDRHLSRRP